MGKIRIAKGASFPGTNPSQLVDRQIAFWKEDTGGSFHWYFGLYDDTEKVIRKVELGKSTGPGPGTGITTGTGNAQFLEIDTLTKAQLDTLQAETGVPFFLKVRNTGIGYVCVKNPDGRYELTHIDVSGTEKRLFVTIVDTNTNILQKPLAWLSEIEDLKDDLADINTSITTIENNISDIKTEIFNIDQRVTQIAQGGTYKGSYTQGTPTATPDDGVRTAIPSNKSQLVSWAQPLIAVNDFITWTGSDGISWRYVLTGIDAGTGNLTWMKDIRYTADVSGKVDKITQPDIVYGTKGNGDPTGYNLVQTIRENPISDGADKIPSETATRNAIDESTNDKTSW